MHTDSNLGAFEEACTRVVSDTAGLLAWEWDDWQSAALTKLDQSATERVLEMLDRAFDQQWTHDTVEGCSAAAAVAHSCGGLRPGQRLLLSDSNKQPMMAGFWWPWNDGRTISLRIRLLSASGDTAEQDHLSQQLRGWFGL